MAVQFTDCDSGWFREIKLPIKNPIKPHHPGNNNHTNHLICYVSFIVREIKFLRKEVTIFKMKLR